MILSQQVVIPRNILYRIRYKSGKQCRCQYILLPACWRSCPKPLVLNAETSSAAVRFEKRFLKDGLSRHCFLLQALKKKLARSAGEELECFQRNRELSPGQ